MKSRLTAFFLEEAGIQAEEITGIRREFRIVSREAGDTYGQELASFMLDDTK